MPNLIITGDCQNDCCYCFLGENRGEELSLSAIKRLWPFIDGYEPKTVSLMGGEPSRHPEFLPIIDLFLTKGYTVKVFTNGKIPLDTVRSLQTIQGDFSFCVNRTDPFLDEKIRYFYRTMGYKIQLGLTYYRTNQPLDHLKDEIAHFNLEKVFRLGIALPVWPARNNQFLSPIDYPTAAAEIFSAIGRFLESDIRPEFDCGFPYCFFSRDQQLFLRSRNIDFVSRCGIIPDIGPNDSVKPCLPLSCFSVPFSGISRPREIEQQFSAVLNQHHTRQLFPQCRHCHAPEQKLCCGGCLAARLL